MTTTITPVFRDVHTARARACKSHKSPLYAVWFMAFMMLSLIRPVGFGEIYWLMPFDTLLGVGQVISFVAAVWLFRDNKIRLFLGLFVAIVLIQSGVTLVSSGVEGMLSTGFYSYCKILTFVLLIGAYLRTPYFQQFLLVCAWMCGIVLIANTVITFAINPQGLYSDFSKDLTGTCFYGDKNALRNPALFGFAASALLDVINGGKLSPRTLLVAAAGLSAVVAVWSATSIVCLILAFAFYSFVLLNRNPPHIWFCITIIAVLFCLVVFVDNLGFMGTFVEDVLGRSMDFSGRKSIWQTVLGFIGVSPIIGEGFNGSILVQWGLVSHAHNAYLDMAFKGGVCALAIFLLLIGLCCRKLSDFWNTKEAHIITGVLFAFLLAGVFGSLDNIFFYGLLYLAYNVEAIVASTSVNIHSVDKMQTSSQSSRLTCITCSSPLHLGHHLRTWFILFSSRYAHE